MNKINFILFIHTFLKWLTLVYVIASSYYGMSFPSVVCKENIIGVQFHPEKSGNSGQKVLINWLTNY